MIFGYIRVSTKEQNEGRQLIAMQECKFKIDKTYMDKQSGKDFDRIKYKKMISKFKKTNILKLKVIDFKF